MGITLQVSLRDMVTVSQNQRARLLGAINCTSSDNELSKVQYYQIRMFSKSGPLLGNRKLVQIK